MSFPIKIHVGPVIDEGHSLASVSDKVGGIVLKRKITLGWVFGLLISFAVLQSLMAGATWLFIKGVGVWGINIPIGWGFAIVNFVWWIGIGHAGTLISAILLLLNQSWRNAINRFAEAMTLFAVMCAGMFPVLHTGRPWLAYWLFPYPNTMDLWPQFRSPLLWDVFAVSTYFTISAVFWFVGLLPDLATLRDTAQNSAGSRSFTARWPWAGAVRRATGSDTKKLRCCSPDWRRRWWFPSTPSSASTSRFRSFPAGTPRSSRLTSSRAPSTPVSRWC